MRAFVLIAMVLCGCAGAPKAGGTATAEATPVASNPQTAVNLWVAEHPQISPDVQTERLNLRDGGYDVLLRSGAEHYLLRVEVKGEVWEVVSSAPCDADFLIPSL